MRILVDATAIPPDRGGVGRYVDALLPALERAGARLVVACQQRDQEATARLVPSAEVVAAPAASARRPVRLAWEQTGLPRLVRASRVDVLHSPHYTLPLAPGVPVVATLHDATFFSHPELHTPIKARFFRAAIRVAVRRSSILVVPSRATQSEVQRYAGGRDDQFEVAYHGVDPALFHPTDAAAVRSARDLLGLGDRPYIAFLGTLEPRKNVPALIEGWVSAAAGMPDPPVLVLAGGPGWDDRVEPAVRSVPPGLTVLRPGYLPLDQLAGYLSGARVVAYPSLGEGFGLPVLEAMACGAAVMTTRELSLPEVGGEAVAYCSTEPAGIAATLQDLLADEAERRRLGAAALDRASGFTWDIAAQAHLRAYRRASAEA